MEYYPLFNNNFKSDYIKLINYKYLPSNNIKMNSITSVFEANAQKSLNSILDQTIK